MGHSLNEVPVSMNAARPAARPPGPPAPFEVTVDPATFEVLPRWSAAYGPLLGVRSPHNSRQTYVLFEPELVRHVLVTHHRNYAKGRGFERVKMLLGNGLIVSDGPLWRRRRRMLQPAFQRPSVERLSAVMRAVTHRYLQRWRAAAEEARALDITRETSAFALDVILESIFGQDLAAWRDEAGHTPFHILVDETVRDLRLAVQFRALRKRVIELAHWRRKRDVQRMDFLGHYLAARDAETGAPLDDEALADEVMTLIVAGHETTGVTLNWIWHLLAWHPEAAAQLQAEVDTLPTQAPPRFADLPRLPCARRVMDEALRLYPPVWLFTRRAVAEDHLGGFRVPVGTEIAIPVYTLHRHPDHWQAPEVFDPDRFLPERTRARHRYAYLPFSMGARRCTGEVFAQTETLIHLGWVARHLTFEPLDPEVVPLEPGVNLRPARPIRLLPHLRRQDTD